MQPGRVVNSQEGLTYRLVFPILCLFAVMVGNTPASTGILWGGGPAGFARPRLIGLRELSSWHNCERRWWLRRSRCRRLRPVQSNGWR